MKQKEDKVKQIQEIKLLVGWEFVAVNIKICLKSMPSTDTHANQTQIRNMEIIKAILIIIW